MSLLTSTSQLRLPLQPMVLMTRLMTRPRRRRLASALRAAPPTITDEHEAEAYDLLMTTISESVLTRLLNVDRTARAVWVSL